MSKLMKLRRDGVCAACQTQLASGTNAHWFAAEHLVRCVECCGSAPAHVEPTLEDSSAAELTDIAGGSAQGEYDRRSTRELANKEKRISEDAEWRVAIKEQRPVLGRVAAALTPKPQITPESQSTRAWKVGAEGERRVAEVLEQAAGIEVLHDRLVPGSRANIDHIAIGPSGVFVIDAKKYTGQIEVRDVGGLFRTDQRLYVNNRDRTKVVDGVLHQVDVVRTALGDDFSDVPVRGVLCFVGCEWGWIMRTKSIKDVTALWPTALPNHVAVAGLHAERIGGIADRLRTNLRPAT